MWRSMEYIQNVLNQFHISPSVRARAFVAPQGILQVFVEGFSSGGDMEYPRLFADDCTRTDLVCICLRGGD